MFRLTRKDVEVELAVALTIEFRKHLLAIRSKDRTKADAAMDTFIAKLASTICNDSTCVVRTDSPGIAMAPPRKFGIEEPWPAQLDMERHSKAP
jgi:hypothetical protein